MDWLIILAFLAIGVWVLSVMWSYQTLRVAIESRGDDFFAPRNFYVANCIILLPPFNLLCATGGMIVSACSFFGNLLIYSFNQEKVEDDPI